MLCGLPLIVTTLEKAPTVDADESAAGLRVVNTRWPSKPPLVAVEVNCTSSRAPGVLVPPTATPVPLSRIKEFSILQALVNLATVLAVAKPSLVTGLQAPAGGGVAAVPLVVWLTVGAAVEAADEEPTEEELAPAAGATNIGEPASAYAEAGLPPKVSASDAFRA